MRIIKFVPKSMVGGERRGWGCKDKAVAADHFHWCVSSIQKATKFSSNSREPATLHQVSVGYY